MKIIHRFHCAFGCVVALAATSTIGAAEPHDAGSGWYLRGGLGPEITQQTDVTLNFTLPAAETKFETGFRFDVAAGFRLPPRFEVEGETGLIVNSIRSIAGSPDTDADLIQLPLLANLVFRSDRESRFTPYAALGAGVVAAWLDIDRATLQGSSLRGNNCAFALAGQIFAGFRYHLSERVHFDCAYKLLATTAPEWDLPSYDPTKTFGVIKLKTPLHHSASFAITVEF